MNTPTKIMENGLTGCWMRVASDQSVKAVSGTMYRLLRGKNAFILTHILSPRMHRTIVLRLLSQSGIYQRMGKYRSGGTWRYGLIGLKAKFARPALVNSMKLQRLKTRRLQAAMLQNTYSSLPFSKLNGLPDGSASATLKAFQKRRNGSPSP